MKFRLGTIAYVFALLATGMAAFGAWGIVRAGGVLLFWGWMSSGISRRRPAWRGVVALLILGATQLLLPGLVPAAHSAIQRQLCISNIKQLAMILYGYENVKGALPPAVLRDSQGNELHSWRTLILPMMDQAALSRRIDQTKPWNSPANQLLSSTSLTLHHCPADANRNGTTNYFAVVGARTAWPPDRGRRLDEIADGGSNTILLIEAPHRNIHWGEPSDLTFDEAVDVLSGKAPDLTGGHPGRRGFLYKPQRHLMVAFVDGHVAAVALPLSRELATALLTVDGGEKFEMAELSLGGAPELDYRRVWALLAFVGVAVWPGVRMWRNARKSPRFEEPRANGANG